MFGDSVLIRRVIWLILLASIIVGALFLLRDDNKDYKQSEISEQMSELTLASVEKNSIVGVFNGVMQLLDDDLLFPRSRVEFEEENYFTMVAEDFNIALLGNDKLKVNSRYPIFDMKVEGVYEDAGDNILLKIQTISTSFRIFIEDEYQGIDTATTEELFVNMRSSGIVIPTVSEDVPYVIEVKTTFQEDRLELMSIPESSKMLYFHEKI